MWWLWLAQGVFAAAARPPVLVEDNMPRPAPPVLLPAPDAAAAAEAQRKASEAAAARAAYEEDQVRDAYVVTMCLC